MDLSEMELDEYKKHPRVLEVRFMLFFDMLEKDYGYQGAIKFVESICKAFNCNFMFLNSLINRRFDVKRKTKVRWRLWRQEVIFTAGVYGERIYTAAEKYLHIKANTLYAQSDLYSINKFCDAEWLRGLDERVVLCGQPGYRLEVIRFFEVVDDLSKILKKWQGDE